MREEESVAQETGSLLVVIDVGNTNTVFGVYDGDRLIHDVRLSTSTERTADELGALLLPLFARPA